MKYTSHSLEETKKIAQQFISELKPRGEGATIVALQGDLGSGKTAFTKLVLELLGVVETVTSPTFVIEKIYKIKHPDFSELVHIDAYRLNDVAELKTIGWPELIKDPKKIILLEWPEMVAVAFDGSEERINFTFVDEATREIYF